MNPVLTPDFIGDALNARVLTINAHAEPFDLSFNHKGGGDVVAYLFEAGSDVLVATAHVHLTGEGQS